MTESFTWKSVCHDHQRPVEQTNRVLMDETPIILIEPAPPTAEQLRGERERLERAFLNACRRRRPDLAWHIRRDEAAQRD